MQTFYKLLGNALIVTTTNNFVWFALTFWIYLETKSVISTSMLAGIYLVVTALSGFWLGSIVDHHRKKKVMLASSFVSLSFYTLGFLFYILNPESVFTSVSSPILWSLVLLLMAGVLPGNIYNIAIPTLTTILVPEDRRAKANGLFGTVVGIAFGITSVASGFVLAFGGMFSVIIIAMIATFIAIVYLLFIPVVEKKIVHTGAPGTQKKIDIKGTIKVIKEIPGFMGLLFFNMFNNFLGGAFMALMDAYGLSLVSVQVWGLLWGLLSLGFIVGGLLIAKLGLGVNPVRTLFRINVLTWIVCIFMAIQPSIILLVAGMMVWMIAYPFIEASEQTIIQKVVPHDRQGRVFGFAQSVEQSAAPLTAFMIGPITQLIFIPYMTTGAGVDLIGDWFGTGQGRGIALVFTITGVVGLIVTLIAMRSRSYKLLTEKYLKH